MNLRILVGTARSAFVLLVALEGPALAQPRHAGERCPEGQAVGADTQGHCCWPQQVWSRSRRACVGIPVCPAGLLVRGETCEISPCPDGQRRSEDTAGRCCWPRQVWSGSRSVCVGVPACPEGFSPVGESCAVTPVAPAPTPRSEVPAPVPVVTAVVAPAGELADTAVPTIAPAVSGVRAAVSVEGGGDAAPVILALARRVLSGLGYALIDQGAFDAGRSFFAGATGRLNATNARSLRDALHLERLFLLTVDGSPTTGATVDVLALEAEILARAQVEGRGAALGDGVVRALIQQGSIALRSRAADSNSPSPSASPAVVTDARATERSTATATPTPPVEASPRTPTAALVATLGFGGATEAGVALRLAIPVRSLGAGYGRLALSLDVGFSYAFSTDAAQVANVSSAALAVPLVVGVAWLQSVGPVMLLPRVGVRAPIVYSFSTGEGSRWSLDWALSGMVGVGVALPRRRARFLGGVDLLFGQGFGVVLGAGVVL